MWEYVNQETSILFIWMVLVILKKLRMKRGDFDVLLLVPALVAYIIFFIVDLASIPIIAIQLYSAVGLGYTLLTIDVKKMGNETRVKKKYKTLKKAHANVVQRSEVLRERFIHMLDLVDDGIAFRSDDDTMFGTKRFIDLLRFDNHEFTFETFMMKMHPDDQTSYLETLDSLSKKPHTYTAHYRIKKDGDYHWFKENGVRLKQDKRIMYIAVLRGLDVKKYPQSNVEVLNNLPFEKAYFEHIQKLNKSRNPYSIVTIELTNIPAVNKKYGRDIGDLMMGEYIKKLAYHFLKDIHAVFRLSGIRFAMIITDHRKTEMLKRVLEEGGDLITYTMHFGSVSETIFPAFGLTYVKMFDEPVDEIAQRAEKALNIALDDNTTDHYFIFNR